MGSGVILTSHDRYRIYNFRLFKPSVLVLATVVGLLFALITWYIYQWPVGLAVPIAIVVGAVLYVAKL